MSDSNREAVLGSLRRALGRDAPVDEDTAAKLRARMTGHARNIVPARTALDDAGLVELFETMAQKVHATVAHVASMDDVPGAVGEYLRGENLPSEIVMAPDATLDAAPWSDNSLLEIRRGAPVESDQVSVTSAPGCRGRNRDSGDVFGPGPSRDAEFHSRNPCGGSAGRAGSEVL